MAKTFKATWLGDGDPQAQIIEEGGLRFIKGEPTDVPHDHVHNGIAWADNIRANPAFAIGEKNAEVVESPEERKALTDQLDAAGIKYPANASVETLRGKLPA
jgi:hypothetical protein